MPDFPDINIEIISDYALADTVADRYDAGVRLGEHVDKDMISVRIGPDFRLVVVGAPSYFENHARTTSPQELTEYSCIGLRLPTHGGFYAWPFGKDGRELNKRVRGRAAFNSMDMRWKRHSLASDLPWSPMMSRARTWRPGGLCRFLQTGHRAAPVITSIIPVAASTRLRLR